MKKITEIALVMVVVFVFNSCSKLQNNVLTPVQSQSDIHPSGWATQTSANFHGSSIKANNYDMTTCTSCHGNDLAGGIVKVSCYKCHQGSNGTLACNTCHGNSLNPAPPKDLSEDSLSTYATVGAHQNHLVGDGPFAKVDCSSCHLVPQAVVPDCIQTEAMPLFYSQVFL